MSWKIRVSATLTAPLITVPSAVFSSYNFNESLSLVTIVRALAILVASSPNLAISASVLSMSIMQNLFSAYWPVLLVVAPMVVRSVFGYGASYPVIWGYVGTSLGLGGAVGSYVWAAVSENLGGFTAVFGIAVVCIILVLVLGLIAYSMRDKLPRERLTEADLDR